MTRGLFDLHGKVTVITGGNSGLGLGFARGIARQGGDLEIWARNAERNAAAKKELEAYGVRVITRQVDVASEPQIIAAYAALLQESGRVDCVIANAGLPPPRTRSMLELSTREYLDFIDVSLHGAFYTLREGARLMVQRAEAGERGGSLVFCGSLSMFKGLPGKPSYAGSKGAMGAIVRSMAAEFGKYGIRANTVAPGYIKTGMTGAGELSDLDRFMMAKNAIPRPGYMADFEGIAAYLASDASAFHSGDTLTIDGGSMVMM
ncbi:NAD(P)-dependent dehydrogenase, short-chain alcohol dehydrogenase family [Solimonas aquatica]|uniref:NAD(P)-dependent dehydrogenase, short-chain alcohol dehydrogenase family n=1 Tax=Solimonas aquatica TaxID=489703 RepID=A0A1H9GDV6_9GAMM|nr:SDR family oxidoreductase [Solimonas aquatica]SEQ48259.1 NAD(P)-dependent dehydrogenase, short-chain alcohol dehydrogenase family [Solimonas aquatica]